MSTPFVLRPALLAHTFWPVADVRLGIDPAAAVDRWWAAADRLGISKPIDGLPFEPRPPGPPSFESRPHVLGARGSGRAGGVEQALAYQVHDTVGCTVMLAPHRDKVGWIELTERWQAGSASDDGAMGTVTVYLGLTPEPVGIADLTDLGKRLRRVLPTPAEGGWPQTACVFHHGIAVWELPERDPEPPLRHRRLVVVAPRSAEDALDRWLWVTGGPGLPPLTQYLLHAAKLRYQHAVLTRDLPRLRKAASEAEALCGTLAGQLQQDPLPADGLVQSARNLAVLQAQTDGLIASLSRARTMAQTVETARVNQSVALEQPAPDSEDGLLDRDRQVARWTAEQLRSEMVYLQAITDRAAQLLAGSKTVIDEATRERTDSRVLVQASLLGGLLTALATVQSLGYTVAVPRSLQAPIIALLASVAGWLPSAVLHWAPSARVSRRWLTLDLVLLAAPCASVGWLVTTAVVRLLTGSVAPPWSTALAAVLAASAGTLLARLTRRKALR